MRKRGIPELNDMEGKEKMRASYSLDLTEGSVTKKLFLFSMPILLTQLLQHLYGIADKIVVGQFAPNGEVALAAVGATAAATTLILNIFVGMAGGANVVCANLCGAHRKEDLDRCMHTSILLAVVTGLILGFFGIFISKPLLQLMATPAEVLGDATLYMQIYFLGVPASMICNFSSAILRAHGDAKRPMYIFMFSGLVNVLLNLLMVVGFGRGVDGVAIATVASQVVAAVIFMWILFDPKQEYQLQLKKLYFHKVQLLSIVRVGVPNGLNGMVFSLSNVVVQSSVNSFNSTAIIAGKTAATDVSMLMYQVIYSFYTACVSFSGQCYGAGKYRRIDSALKSSVLTVWSFILVMATVCTIFPRQILGLFNSSPEVIDAGINIMLICCWGYILYTVSEVFLGGVRGMGYSLGPTILNLAGICLPRLLWIWFVFPMHRTIEFLFLCYPISWLISAILQVWNYFHCRRKLIEE